MDIDHRGRPVSSDGKWRWDGKQWNRVGEPRRARAGIFIFLAAAVIVLAVVAAAFLTRPHTTRHAGFLPALTQTY
jgi:hypothetical protein